MVVFLELSQATESFKDLLLNLLHVTLKKQMNWRDYKLKYLNLT